MLKIGSFDGQSIWLQGETTQGLEEPEEVRDAATHPGVGDSTLRVIPSL